MDNATKRARQLLTVRLPLSLNAEIDAYATRKGISKNAAACVLLASGAQQENRRENRRPLAEKG